MCNTLPCNCFSGLVQPVIHDGTAQLRGKGEGEEWGEGTARKEGWGEDETRRTLEQDGGGGGKFGVEWRTTRITTATSVKAVVLLVHARIMSSESEPLTQGGERTRARNEN